MIYTYAISQQGAYHVKNGLPCQDAHAVLLPSEHVGIAAVADGLGSELYTDVASRIAADVSTSYCAEHISEKDDEEHIISVMKASFALAQRSIEAEAEKLDRPLDEYDTTLSLAVLISGTLYYGHAGDSGILALGGDGLYKKITEQQRDGEGRVFPLYFGEEKWVFGKHDGPVSSVLLATDGIYELFFPVYIREEPVSIHVALARYLMDADSLGFARQGAAAVRERIYGFLNGIPESQVSDDKTVVVMCDTDIPMQPQPDAYYREPDWNRLKEKYEAAWRKEAYPERGGTEETDKGQEKP